MPRDSRSVPRADDASIPRIGSHLATALVAPALWHDVFGADPARASVQLTTDAVTRISIFDVAVFANAMSARAGFSHCYSVTCEVGPEDGGGTASGERVAWLLREHAGCPRADQPWCIDTHACRVEFAGDDACGYRLPTLSEWSEVQGTPTATAGTVAEWVWPDDVTALDSDTPALVAGRTALSTATVPADRVVPAVAAMKAMHIGFRLARGPVRRPVL